MGLENAPNDDDEQKRPAKEWVAEAKRFAPVQVTAAEALELVGWEIDALPESDLVQINFDVLRGAAMVLGCYPELLLHRPAIVATFKNFDLRCLDRLELYAKAANAANTAYLAVPKPIRAERQLAAALRPVRRRWMRDLQSLVERRMIGGNPLEALKRGWKDADLAHDLLLMGRVARESAESTGTLIPDAEVSTTEARAIQLLELVIVRDHREAPRCNFNLRRKKAFALFVHAYDQVRRALTFLRWSEGDVGKIAPALPAFRRRKRSPKKTKLEVARLESG